jgi:hypothetical protein
MVHPTCAPARRPDESPAADNAGNLAMLTAKAVDEINASREAYHAVACISNLVASARSAPDHKFVTTAELRGLVELVNAEFERRVQLAKATIESMQAPERARGC